MQNLLLRLGLLPRLLIFYLLTLFLSSPNISPTFRVIEPKEHDLKNVPKEHEYLAANKYTIFRDVHSVQRWLRTQGA